LALGVDRSSVRYVSHRPDQAPLMLRIRDLAATRTRYGYFRIYILLRREGWAVNHKRVYRLYRDDGLSLRLKKLGATSALPTATGNPQLRRPARCGRWTSSRTRCSTAGGCER
jgi:transposase InsO family protein